jgi:hypothetical protein
MFGGSTMWMLPRSLVLSLTKDDAGGAEDGWPWPVDEDYWLGHCHGFQVDGPDGRVGVVEHVAYGSHIHRPDVVWVRSGLWRSHAVSVPVAEVTELRPAQARLVVRGQLAAPRRVGLRWRARRVLRAWARREQELHGEPCDRRDATPAAATGRAIKPW